MGIARTVGTFIVAFIFLVLTVNVIHFFVIQTLNDYVFDTLLDPQDLQENWQSAVRACERLKPPDATWTCEERLQEYSTQYGIDLTATGFLPDNNPFLPYKNNWYAMAFNKYYLITMVVLSALFAGIAEAGGKNL